MAPEGSPAVLWFLAIALLALWALGFITSAAVGGVVHVLVAIAVVAMLVRLIQDRRAG
jgi:uncharacterized membrane protein YtjA (UPF0391 family)